MSLEINRLAPMLSLRREINAHDPNGTFQLKTIFFSFKNKIAPFVNVARVLTSFMGRP